MEALAFKSQRQTTEKEVKVKSFVSTEKVPGKIRKNY